MFRTIFPVQSMCVALFAAGEGWHNYHHAFPWDYRASELGSPLNLTGFLIDLLAKIGLVYDRKEATGNMIKNRALRTGDNSHHNYGNDEGRSAFKTLFNIWRHPSNPTYTSLFSPKPKIINGNGYALEQKELAQNEVDDDILKTEIAEMEKKLRKDSELNAKVEQTDGVSKYIVDKPEVAQTTLIGKLSKFMAVEASTELQESTNECNNNNNLNTTTTTKNKSDLNINVDEVILVKL